MKTLAKFPLFSLAAAWLLAGTFAQAASFGTLSDEVTRTVSIIKSSLNGSTDIKLTEFTDLSLTKFSGAVSPLIQEEFKAAFQKERIALNDSAAHILTGQFLVTDEESLKKGDPLQLTIKLGLVNRRGQKPVDLLPIFTEEPDAEHFGKITSTRDLTKAVGFVGKLTSDLEFQKENNTSQQVPEHIRQKELTEQLLNPHGHVSGNRVRSVADSPYEIEILAKSATSNLNYESRRPRLEDGLPYVDLEQHELYAIKIYNNTDKDVAVSLSVDGLNVFHFCEDQFRKEDGTPKFSYYIVHPRGYTNEAGARYDGTLTVLGWFQRLKAPDNYLTFMITELGKGAVSKAGIQSRAQVGVIHAQFSNCFPLPVGQAARSGKETGFGPPASQEARQVSYEMEPAHEFISIRYDRP